jgi:hypothetical protein
VTVQETTYRGIRWQQDEDGQLRFYDPDGGRWITWAPGVDAPPLPPGWGGSARAGRGRRTARAGGGAAQAGGVERPSWRSRWRLIPVVVIVAVLVIAVVQGLRPSASQAHKEAKATAALLGKCLPQNGTSGGRPQYSAAPVPCDSATAAVRVVQVVPSTPGSPVCPADTVGVELPYPGVRYPHVLCIERVDRSG